MLASSSLDWHMQFFDDAKGKAGRRFRSRQVRGQDRELIAAQPGHQIARSHGPRKPPANLDQHLIAGRVAENVVHPLEPVQIQHQHAMTAHARRRGDPAAQGVVELPPVRQAVQGVAASPRIAARRRIAGTGNLPTPPDLTETAALARAATFTGEVLHLPRAALRDAPPDGRRRVVAAAATSCGGGQKPPLGDRTEALAQRLAGPEAFTATLAGMNHRRPSRLCPQRRRTGSRRSPAPSFCRAFGTAATRSQAKARRRPWVD